MPKVEKIVGAAFAGAITIIAIFAILPPLLKAFSDLAKEIAFPVSLVVGLIMLALAVWIFEKVMKGR